jgi:titin
LIVVVLVLLPGNASAADSGPLDYAGDAELAQAAVDGECTGSGTEADPYVFADYNIECTGAGYGIWLRDTDSHVRLENCTFHNCSYLNDDLRGGAVYLQGSSNVTVVDCRFHSCEWGIISHMSDHCLLARNDLSNITISGAWVRDSSNMSVENCFMDGMAAGTTYGLFVQGSENVTINHTEIIGCDKGLHVERTIRVVLNNLTLDMQSQYGAYLDECSDVTIRDTSIKAGAMGIHCAYTSDLTISGMDIDGLSGYGIVAEECAGLWVRDNVINDTVSAIRLFSCTGVVVERNLAINCTNYGMELNAEGGLVADNIIRDSVSGISIWGGDLMVQGNQVEIASGYAVIVLNSANVTVYGNWLEAVAEAFGGIDMQLCENATASDNTVTGTFSIGIRVYDCQNATVHHNAVDNVGQTAIDVYRGGWADRFVRLTDNTAAGLVVRGILATESPSLLISGNVMNGFENGIWIDSCYDVLIEGNDVDLCTLRGIFVQNGGGSTDPVVLVNNSCRMCDIGIVLSQVHYSVLEGNDCDDSQVGLSLFDSQLTFIGNCTADRCQQGLVVSGGHATFVLGGSYSHCTDSGMYLSGSDSTTIEAVEASHNVNYGLYLTNSIQGQVIGSNLSWNLMGVRVSQDSNHDQPLTVEGCLLENNTEYGLHGNGGWLTSIRGNHIANNLNHGIYLAADASDWRICNNTFLQNRGLTGLNVLTYQCYDLGSNNRWSVYEGERYWGNGWSHLPNIDMDEDGYVDYNVRIGRSSSPGYISYGYQLPYGPRIEGPSAPENLTHELTPYHIQLSWTAPQDLGNSTLTGYYVYMGDVPDLQSMWEAGQTYDELEFLVNFMLQNGMTYYFAVLGFNEYGMLGDPSDILEVYYQPYPMSNSGPITIHSDQEFADAATAHGWPGDGSAGNPYLIEDLVIDGQGWGYSIQIWHTVSYFVVRNCTFYMGMSMDFGDRVDLWDVFNGRFEDCDFLGVEGHGLVLETGQVDVANCLFDGAMGRGMHISYGYGVHVDDCAFNGTLTAIRMQYSVPISAEGCLFGGCPVGIDAYDCSGLVVRGCEFRGGEAVRISYSDDCLLEDIVGVSVYSFLALERSDGAVVRNNTANGTYMSDGISIEYGSATLMEGNLLSGFYRGLYAFGTTGLSVRNNSLVGNQHGARMDQAGNVEMIGNNVSANLEHGLVLGFDNTDVEVTLNAFLGNQAFAVQNEGGSDAVVIHLNHFQGNNQNDGTFTYATVQASDEYGSFTWSLDGSGNHWSDWTAPDDDGDGVVDLPYSSELGVLDPCPLVHPFGPPAGLECSVGPDHVNLSWGELDYDFIGGVDGYRIYRGTSPGALVLLDSSEVRWYNDTSVTLGTTYYYRVSAFVSLEEGVMSELVSATPCDVPDAPTGLAVEGALRSLQLSWTAPADDGGAAVLGYVIWRGASPGGLAQYDVVGAVVSYTDLLVGDDETYYYAVTAFNQAGNGSASAVVGNTTFGLASAPLNLAALFGDANVTLSWEAPSDDGRTPLTGYVIEYVHAQIGQFAYPGADDRSWLITGLTNGWEYSFRVRALNSVGDGEWSPAVLETPATVPGAPGNLTAAGSAGSVSLAWMAPSEDGGNASSSYSIYRMEIDGEWTWIGNSSSLAYQDLSAVDGVVYFYRVSAVNKAGEGEPGIPARAVPGLPSAPRDLLAIDSDGRVQLNWSAPADDGGSGIAGYKVYRDGGTGMSYLALVPSGTMGYLDATAMPGTEYRYRVSAVTASGEGPWSAEAAITLPMASPEAPVIDSAVQLEDGVLLTWHMPESSTAAEEFLLYRGAAPEGMVLIAILDGGAAGYLDVTGTAGTFYALRASNQYGVGELGSTFQATLGIVLPPQAPEGLRAMAADSAVTLEWDPSEGATGYHVHRDDGSGYVIVATTASAGYVDGNALNGVAYSYRVSAFNEGGESGNSSAALATPGRAPGAVGNFTLQALSSSMVLFWSAPADDGGAAVLGYRVHRSLNGTTVLLATVASPGFADHSAMAGMPHTYWVVAVNAWGPGAESPRLNATLPAADVQGLPAPAYLLASVGDRMVTLTWDPMEGLDVDGFLVLRADGGDFVLLGNVSGGIFVDRNVSTGVEYLYQVRCFIGGSEGLNRSVAATPGTAPGSPELTVQGKLDRIDLSWTAPEDGGSTILGYRVYRSPGAAGNVLIATVTGLSYSDGNVLSGTNYTYTVTAVNAFGEGLTSNAAMAMASWDDSVGTEVPGTPTIISAIGGNASIAVTWSAPADDGDAPLSGFSIYRGTTPLARQLLVTLPAGTTAYTDSAVSMGSTYYYWVAALNRWGESPASMVLSASLVRLEAPGAVAAEAEPGQGRVALSWNAPQEQGSSPVTGYLVYRAEAGEQPQLLASVPSSATTFVDASVEPGVEYSYWVVAVSQAGEGEMSATAATGVPLAVITGEAQPGLLYDLGLIMGILGLAGAAAAIVLVLRKR